jgi:hypothetical protein
MREVIKDLLFIGITPLPLGLLFIGITPLPLGLLFIGITPWVIVYRYNPLGYCINGITNVL